MSDLTLGFNHSSLQSVSLLYKYQQQSSGTLPADETEEDGDSASITDILDLSYNKGQSMSVETVMAVMEKHVNARIEAKFSTKSVDETEQAEDDYWSAENTGTRIANFALGFYGAYAAQNGGESEANLDKFLSLITDAIDEGISQAEGIISEAHGGEVPTAKASLIADTRSQIMKILEDFRTNTLEKIRGTTETDTAPEAA